MINITKYHNFPASYVQDLHVVRGGRIGVTQGRDEDAPTMTPKKYIAIASRAV